MGRSNDELDELLDELDPEDNTVKKLRKLVEKRGQRIAELEEENTKLSKVSRSSTVAEVLKSKGVNEKVAALVPADVDATPEAITQWLTDYADVFGIKQNAPAGEQEREATGGSEVDPEVEAALQSINSTVATSQTPGKEADILARLNDPNLTFEELQTLMAQNGGTPLS